MAHMSAVVIWVLVACVAAIALVTVLGRWAYRRLREEYDRDE